MKNRKTRRGAALVTTALALIVIVPAIGLAIDGSVLYLVRLRLSQALDAGVLAGARSLSVGVDFASQKATAESTARRYFKANFPDGFWGTTNSSTTPNAYEKRDNSKIRVVEMTAGVDVPLYFMRILGVSYSQARVLRAATATRRDVNVMMVLDRSGSMEQAHAIDDLQDAAGKFVNKFAAGRDKVGMLTFGGASYLPYRLSVNFKTGSPNIPDMIRNIEGGGATNTSQALWLAYNELQAQDEPGALNVIVLFTDGQPTAFTANFQPYLAGTSSCQNKNTPKLGFLTFSTSGASSSLGILYPTRNTFEADDELQRFADNSQNCAYTGDPRRVTLDVSRMPPNDSYGNLTSGYAGTPTSISPTHVEMASINATDNSARRIRTDDRLRPVIFVIGLGGANPPDKELMKRLANDPAASNYDRSQSAGLFVWSPSAAQLQDAFLRIASEILRLSI